MDLYNVIQGLYMFPFQIINSSLIEVYRGKKKRWPFELYVYILSSHQNQMGQVFYSLPIIITQNFQSLLESLEWKITMTATVLS